MGNFRKGLMASEDVRTLLVTGAFYGSDGKRAEVMDGAVVVVGDLEDHSIYEGVKDLNTRKLTAPAADTDSVAIVDYDGVSSGEIMGVMYRDGIKTYGLTCPKGEKVRVRKLWVGDSFWLDKSNFASEPTVGQYAVPTASDVTWTPAGSAETTKTCIKIEVKKNVTEGTVDTHEEYLCTVVNVM